MKVQRCPSCGARYNADRLEPGAVFACNRCGAEVTVESSARPAPSLLLAGLLVLAALFVWNPLAATTGPHWPWDLLDRSPSPPVLASTALWAALGLWAALTALVPGARARSTVSLGLGTAALALAASSTTFGGFVLDPARPFLWVLAVASLASGAGLALEGRRGAATAGLLAGGSLALLLLAATTFSDVKVSAVEQIVTDIRSLASGEPGEAGLGVLLGRSGAQAVALLAALGGLVVAMGARSRALCLTVGLLLLGAMLLPGAARIGQALEPGFTWDDAGRIAAHGAGGLLVTDGVALWLLLALAAADLVHAHGPRGGEGAS